MKVSSLSALRFAFALCVAAQAPSFGHIVPSEAAAPIGRVPLPIRIDMGLGPWLPGSLICGGETRDMSFGWHYGMVREGYDRTEQDPYLADFVQGEDATFIVAVEPPGTYRLKIMLGDPGVPRGPVKVTVGKKVVAKDVMTAAGAHQEIVCETVPVKGRIEIRLEGGCKGFAMNGVDLSGPTGSWLADLFPDPGKVDMPVAEDLAPLDQAAKKKLLADLSDYLVRTRPRQGGFSYHGAWYQNAYPIRALLAASRVLNRPQYAEPALAVLDRFAGSQEANGNWYSSYSGSSECDASVLPDTTSANLADIGTMTMCLAAAAPFASPERAERYLAAARRYADQISLPNQLPDGAFPNGRWSGQEFEHAYTIATATQAGSLAALYAATREKRYLAAAEQAGYWLTGGTIMDDGRLVLHPFNQAALIVREATDFGNIFYVAEALLWIGSVTEDQELKSQIAMTLDHWLFGEEGAQKKTLNGIWWTARDDWTNSKMAGMLYVLAGHPRRNEDPRIARWLEGGLAWMADSTRAASIGVGADPAGPAGNFSLAASGFAGIGVAAAIDSTALFLR